MKRGGYEDKKTRRRRHSVSVTQTTPSGGSTSPPRNGTSPPTEKKKKTRKKRRCSVGAIPPAMEYIFCADGCPMYELVAGVMPQIEKMHNISLTSDRSLTHKSRIILSSSSSRMSELLKNGSQDHVFDRFPMQGELTGKTTLSLQGRLCQKFFKDAFPFIPQQWVYPLEEDILQREATEFVGPLICKRPYANRGEGIMLMLNYDAKKLESSLNGQGKDWVVQSYIEHPMLISRKKFDLRLYVVVTSIEPLRAYLCREGIVRLCTEKYARPAVHNINNHFVHLTNYSVNKANGEWSDKNAQDIHGGRSCKRTFSSVLGKLKKKNHDVNLLWRRIKDCCWGACSSILAPLIRVTCRKDFLGSDRSFKNVASGRCYHIFGFDILISKTLEVYLLEINTRPALRMTSKKQRELYNDDPKQRKGPLAVDMYVKSIMMKGALDIVLSQACHKPLKLARTGYAQLHNPRGVQSARSINELADVFIKHTNADHMNPESINSLFQPFIAGLPKSVRRKGARNSTGGHQEWDIRTISQQLKLFKMEKVQHWRKTSSIIRFMMFGHFLHDLLEKVLPRKPPEERLELFLKMHRAPNHRPRQLTVRATNASLNCYVMSLLVIIRFSLGIRLDLRCVREILSFLQ